MIKVKVHVEDKHSDLCVIIELSKDNIETLACMLAREKYPFQTEKNYSVSELEFDLEELKKYIKRDCVHPLNQLVSGDKGLFCLKCEKTVKDSNHIS